jgi:GntR family transcriptional regulator
LATELRINFNTVARAYRLLDEAGLISTQKGRGTYIWETPSPEVSQRLRQQSLEGLTRRYLAQAARQGFSPEEVQASLDALLSGWKAGHPPAEPVEEQ